MLDQEYYDKITEQKNAVDQALKTAIELEQLDILDEKIKYLDSEEDVDVYFSAKSIDDFNEDEYYRELEDKAYQKGVFQYISSSEGKYSQAEIDKAKECDNKISSGLGFLTINTGLLMFCSVSSCDTSGLVYINQDGLTPSILGNVMNQEFLLPLIKLKWREDKQRLIKFAPNKEHHMIKKWKNENKRTK